MSLQRASLLSSILFAAVCSSVSLAQSASPAARAGNDRTVAATYHLGEFVQLKGGQSTGEGLTFAWSATFPAPIEGTPEFGFWDYEDTPNPVAFFPIGTTEVTLTVTDAYGASASDSVLIKVVDKRYLSLVSTYRPWAAELPGKADFILADCTALAALEPGNDDFLTAKSAAQIAKDYESFCQTMRFVYPDPSSYTAIINEYYLAARCVQIEHHEGVAFHIFFGKGKSWSNREKRCFEAAIDAVEIGETDLEAGTAGFPAP